MVEYNIGDKFIVEIINKTDEPLSPYINGQTKNLTVYQLKGIPFMLDADTLSNFERFEKRKKGKWIHFFRSDKCSVCGYDTGKYEAPTWFCPGCGADMREEN